MEKDKIVFDTSILGNTTIQSTLKRTLSLMKPVINKNDLLRSPVTDAWLKGINDTFDPMKSIPVTLEGVPRPRKFKNALDYLEHTDEFMFECNADILDVEPVIYKIITFENELCRNIIAFKNKDNEWRFTIGCQCNLTKEKFIERIHYRNLNDEYEVIDLEGFYSYRKEYLKVLNDF